MSVRASAPAIVDVACAVGIATTFYSARRTEVDGGGDSAASTNETSSHLNAKSVT
jgi:hypothetical protein